MSGWMDESLGNHYEWMSSPHSLWKLQMVGTRYHVLPSPVFRRRGGEELESDMWGAFPSLLKILQISTPPTSLGWPLVGRLSELDPGSQGGSHRHTWPFCHTTYKCSSLFLFLFFIFFMCWILAAWQPPPKILIFFNRCLVFLPKKIERNLGFWRNVSC